MDEENRQASQSSKAVALPARDKVPPGASFNHRDDLLTTTATGTRVMTRKCRGEAGLMGRKSMEKTDY
jgi:hypothetical protein